MSFLRDGPSAIHGNRSIGLPRWLRLAMLGAALVAVVLVASGVLLWHSDAPGSLATCPICHVAHMSVLRAASGPIVAARIALAWVFPTNPLVGYSAAAERSSPPRAPPA